MNCDIELTDWFNIADTLANVIVPSVPTRNDYSLYSTHSYPHMSLTGT